jgi:hypothetical protein
MANSPDRKTARPLTTSGGVAPVMGLVVKPGDALLTGM